MTSLDLRELLARHYTARRVERRPAEGPGLLPIADRSGRLVQGRGQRVSARGRGIQWMHAHVSVSSLRERPLQGSARASRSSMNTPLCLAERARRC
jgi:hypothetical protein